MHLSDVVAPLEADVLFAGSAYEEDDITTVVVSDLMSDVLVIEDTDFLLVSSLASEQVIRTADIVGALGVLLVNGKNPPQNMLSLAESLDQSLLRTRYSSFHACRILARLLFPDHEVKS